MSEVTILNAPVEFDHSPFQGNTEVGWASGGFSPVDAQFPLQVGAYTIYIVHTAQHDTIEERVWFYIDGDYTSGWPSDLVWTDDVLGTIDENTVWTTIVDTGGTTRFFKVLANGAPTYQDGVNPNAVVTADDVEISNGKILRKIFKPVLKSMLQ
jgi:hypothetical protein